MRKAACALLLMIGIVAVNQSRSSATPRVVLASPALEHQTSGDQLECVFTNNDDVPHTFVVRWCRDDGSCEDYRPDVIAPHGANGAANTGAIGFTHCEILTDGHADSFRALIAIKGDGDPHVKVAVPFN